VKILFAVTEDWYFWSHRRALAAVLRSLGCRVAIATRFNQHREALEAIGFECGAVPFERSLRRPLRDLRAALGLWRTVRRLRPDVVHLVSLKPILLSFPAVFLERKTCFVAAITGMGYLFSTDDGAAHRIRRVAIRLLRIVLSRPNVCVIVQNEDDRALIARHGLGSAERTVLIPGVGVDLDEFEPSESEAGGDPVVMLPARLIRDKGIEDFVAAAAIVKRAGVAARFALVGALDPDNPAAIPERDINAWVAAGNVEWWGHRTDMAEVYRESAIVCLPSYREGLPKVLLEAAAVGRAIIATDVPGCREVCRHRDNGLLVPVRRPEALAEAVIELLNDKATRDTYGARGRDIVAAEFSVGRIAECTLAFYERHIEPAHA